MVMMEDPMAEAARPDPGFRVYVERGGARTDVTDAVMDVYDIARNSMDLGSGFLSTEEVGNLRALGKAIGAEYFDYQHDKCLRCGHDYEWHRGEGKLCTVAHHRVLTEGRWVDNGAGCVCGGYTRSQAWTVM